MMRWMHLSDIHLNKEFNDMMSNVMRYELPQYILEHNIKADYLFITGDYRDSAYRRVSEFNEELDIAAKNVSKYILDIARCLNISQDHIYLIPGNHDLERGEEDEKIIEHIINKQLVYTDGIGKHEKKILQDRFEFFRKIHNDIHPEDKGWENEIHRYIETDEFDLLLLNSAIACYGKEKKGEIIIDTIEVEKVMHKPYLENTHKPLFVLSHHSLKYLAPKEQENLKQLFRDRQVFYLCGHSHKLNFSYDDEIDTWEIMVGTTKKADDAAPIISFGEITIGGDLSSLDFYKYDYTNRGRWIPYQSLKCMRFLERLEFFGKNYKLKIKDTQIIQLQMQSTIASTRQERKDTIRKLSTLRYELLDMRVVNTYTICVSELPVTASILIGYALHKRNNISLFYQVGTSLYSNTSPKNKLVFQESIEDKIVNLIKTEKVDLCIYIQAKMRDDGITSFFDYINMMEKSRKLTPYIVMLKNDELYNQNLNLEISSSIISDKIVEYYEAIKKKYCPKVKVHLFYNGFSGLAVLLGNQMPTTFPVQLYDYDMSNQTYTPSFLLKSNIFAM